MDENSEVMDLVDANDEVIGTITRGETVNGFNRRQGYVRFAAGFLVNLKGELWVPIRGLHKTYSPGGFDFSVAEHMHSGESYAQAIERAFKEEAGLSIKADKLVELGKLPPTEDKPYFDAILLYDGYLGPDPKYDEREFSSAQWISPATLRLQLATGASAKPALMPALELLLKHMAKS